MSVGVFIASVCAVGFVMLTSAYYLPQIHSRETLLQRTQSGITLVDRTGKEFFSFYKPYAFRPTKLSDIPPSLQQSVIAIEDRTFYSHHGYSLRGIIRSALNNVQHGSIVYGGSTITQQLIKNTVLNNKRSFVRKIQEIVLATEIEKRYSKKDILEMYLNSVYFGEGAVGVGAAAEVYFGKKPKDLTLAESSLLAGLLVAPTSLSPLSRDPALAKKRQLLVLSEMKRMGVITSKEQKQAQGETLQYASASPLLPHEAPHYALMVRDELVHRYGEDKLKDASWVVHTGLDLDWQQYAEEAVAEGVARLKDQGATNGATVAMDTHTGEIRALVGSSDWDDTDHGKVNMATAGRQVGSAFKPIVYAAAFEKRIVTPATVLNDKAITLGKYTPQNFDRTFHGPVRVRRALANSLNIPAIEVMQQLGVPEVLGFARNLGITTLGPASDYGPSLVLGSGEVPLTELTAAYGVFASEGFYHEPTFVTRIEDTHGTTLYRSSPRRARVIEAETAFLISSILSDEQTRAEEFGSLLNTRVDAAVKTGTTDEYRDSLAMGYTQDVVVGVWVGNNTNRPMDRISGAIGAVPIWKALVEEFAPTKLDLAEHPPGIKELFICPSNGLPVKAATAGTLREYFIEGTVPLMSCTPSPEPTPPVQLVAAPNATPSPTPQMVQ